MLFCFELEVNGSKREVFHDREVVEKVEMLEYHADVSAGKVDIERNFFLDLFLELFERGAFEFAEKLFFFYLLLFLIQKYL